MIARCLTRMGRRSLSRDECPGRRSPILLFLGSLLFHLYSTELLAAKTLEERRGNVLAQAVIDRTQLALSENLELTLIVEGPARVEVAPPRPLLTKASAQLWRVREVGLPLVEVLTQGRQRWKQEFRLSPFEPGPRVEISLEPLKIKVGNAIDSTITWSVSATIEVTTSIARADPLLLRPITGFESVPDQSPDVPAEYGVASYLILVALLIALFGIVYLFQRRKWRSDQKPPHGADWALSQLIELRDTSLAENFRYERLAEVLRLYLQHRFNLPAPRLTTSELLSSLRKTPLISQSLAEQVQAILERCDLSKFTENIGVDTELNDFEAWIDKTVKVISETSSIAQPAPHPTSS